MMLKQLCLFIVLLLSSALSSGEAIARERLALVLGNGQYKTLPVLPNPANDAKLLAETLSNLGYKVTKINDASLQTMRSAILRFGRDLERSGPDSIGFFFYAGHAVQLQGANYLLPVDAVVTEMADLSAHALHLDYVMEQVSQAEVSASFIVIDACRDNPFPDNDQLPRGLAQVRAPRLSVVAYSTEPGGVALDGAGKNSPYTTALVDEMLEPGIPVEQMFKRVRRRLLKATQSQQISWESSSLTEDIYFSTAGAGTNEIPLEASSRKKLEIDWELFDWGEMTAKQRKNWSILGWNEQSWDEETYTPASESKIWKALTAKERAAAEALGYTASLWDGTW